MKEREKLEGRLAELQAENRELQENLANVRKTDQQLQVRAVQNVGAQNEIQRMLQKQSEETAGDDGKPAEPQIKPVPEVCKLPTPKK